MTGLRGQDVRANLERVRKQIEGVGRDPDEIEILAAVKYLPAGQLIGAATIRFADNSGPVFRVPILGGTGAYTGARGVVKVTNLNDGNNSNAEFHLLP